MKLTAEDLGVICPWCMHCGAANDEYSFDAERYCGICANQMPRGREGWLAALEGLTPEMISIVEYELNRIGWSKSGLQPEIVDGMAEAIDRFAALRLSGKRETSGESPEYFARWLDFACTYYPPV